MQFYIPYGKQCGLMVCKNDMKSQPLSACRTVVANCDDKGKMNIWAEGFEGKGVLIPWGKYVPMIMNETDGETGQHLFDRMTGADNEPEENEEESPSSFKTQWQHATYEKP
jgi:hypothetical protein